MAPEFGRLGDDLVRQRVFDAVLGLLKYHGTPAYYIERRKAQREADRLAQVISAIAGDLADLLRERESLFERHNLTGETLDLFACLEVLLEDAERTPEYMAWADYAGETLRPFLVVARTLGANGPNLAELLEVVAVESLSERPRFLGVAPQSRKVTADLTRALLETLDPTRLADLGAPVGFRFTDAAVAELLTVLFAVDTGADSVRKLRAPSG